MGARRLRPYSENDPEFAELKDHLLQRSVSCPVCVPWIDPSDLNAHWNEPHEEPSKDCVVCGGTGTIAGWHALPRVFDEPILEEAFLTGNEEDQIAELRNRLLQVAVTCP